ncbi:AAA family ATPase [Staphylococcus hominis]|uniref:AAA family ATPase n=1 Tax=Staphylococcus hominis TaxID=1290 RepID=UPI001C3D8D3E|nr:AAA family ATPase [Staphylococcus hominis]MBV5220517.1 AAA family ATPase [Staphylococcus hominis]
MLNLKINNVGKINKVDININGITILGAKNDSGKSTISKVLGTSLNALNNYEKLFEEYLNDQIRDLLFTIDGILKNNLDDIVFDLEELPKEYRIFFDSEGRYAFRYFNFKRNFEKNSSIEERILYLSRIFEYIINNYSEKITEKDLNELNNSLNKLKKVHETRIEDVKIELISQFFNESFNRSINNFHNNNHANINITQNDNLIFNVLFNNENHIKKCKTGVSQVKKVIYIESPLILDQIERRKSFFNYNYSTVSYEDDLRYMLLNKKEKNILADNKDIKLKVALKIANIINGKLEKKEKSMNGKLSFKRGSYDIEVLNLATGIKSFAIIQLLLENNWLDNQSLLIIDEPEVHLHPEWQVKFVEILVLINKYLGVNIYINTHSTYLIEGFQIISKNYNIDDTVNYYMLETNDFSSFAKEIKVQDSISNSIEINDSLNKLYDQLNGAFEILDNHKFNWDNENE